MTWKIRHEGSPRSIEGLTAPEVVQGLQDGQWETTDEVMGPQDRDWVAIESHPAFAETAAEIEPPPPRVHDDETRLDMNPLIDVCLVLLIFFILTTSYSALQQVLDMPGVSQKKLEGPLIKTKEAVAEFTIKVAARLHNGKPVIQVEDQIVEPDNLMTALKRFQKDTRKTELLLEAGDDVDWGTLIAIQNAARGAKIQRVHYQVRPEEAGLKSP
jgi:biopolymer transport protein ExbD